MKLHNYILITIAILFGALGHRCQAIALPHLRIPELVSQSDVIVVADVSAFEAISAEGIAFNGEVLPGQRYRVQSVVLYRISGTCPDRFTVEFVLPFAFTGYQYVRRGTRMLFLKKSGTAYIPTNPFYPDFPALRIEPNEMQGKEGTDLVIAELGAVVASPDTSPQEKLEVLVRSYAIPDDNSSFRNQLIAGVQNAGDPDLRSRIQSTLLSRNDVSQLEDVCNALLAGGLSAHQKELLLYGIRSRLENEQAAPQLTRLLQSSSDPDIRTASAEALWHTAAASSIPVLTKALDDDNPNVRYYAIRGLASITGQLQWGPGPAEYEENEAKYREHWLQWASHRSAPDTHH